MSQSEITVFAETNFRNQRRKFGIKLDDRRRHMYLVGKTGMGKSTLLENMIVNDIRAGRGVALVDPHGDLAEAVLQFIPNNRVNDVIYFNPADTQFPVAFNILESVGEDYKHLVAYGLVGVFKKIWADSWGPRMEYIMTNTILALLDYPGSTLLGVMRMLVDKAYRKKVVTKLTDPVVKTFWTDEFANYTEKFRTEAIAPIQNKVGQFLSSAIIRNIVGQSKSTIEMREIMDNQKILIMNLSKGRVGEENSALLGAMMITKLQIAAMSRVDIPESERKDFYLYVDEFQNFATDSFAGILSEARKYRLCLIMAHQYFEQLGDVVKAAVFGNVGTMIIFRVGASDAAELELEFAPQFLPADIVNLKKYCFCMRLMVDGVATEPFSAIGLPPVTGTTDNSQKVIRVSRERYARPQNLVEDRIIRWSGVEVSRADGQVIGAAGEERPDTVEFDDYDTANNVQTRNMDSSSSIMSTSTEEVSDTPVSDVPVIEAESPLVLNTVNPDSFIPSDTESLAEEEAMLEVVSLKRPKISFIDHVPTVLADLPPEPEPVITPTVITTPTAPTPQPQTLTPKPSVIQPLPAKPQSQPQTKVVAPTPLPNHSQVSLVDLQRGTAPQVSFKNPSSTSQPTASQNTVSVKPVTDLIPNPNAAPRKRRRRKRGGSGGGSNQSGQPQNQVRPPVPSQTLNSKPLTPTPQSKPTPAPMVTPKPVVQPIQPKPQPAPIQTPPPSPQKSSDKNKVSWSDILPS